MAMSTSRKVFHDSVTNRMVILLAGALVAATVWCGFPSSGRHVPQSSMDRQQLTGHITRAIVTAPVIGVVSPDERLSVEVGLPVKNHMALREAVKGVSDPRSASFRHYLTPEQFGEQHGASLQHYQAVTEWARTNGLKASTHRNRLIIDVEGSVADLEVALNLHFLYAKRADGTRFRTIDREPSVALSVPIAHISGLDDFFIPPARGAGYGTGPSGTTACGNNNNPMIDARDLRTAYLAGVPENINGAGQTVCVFQGGCVNPNDVQLYVEQAQFDAGAAFSKSQLNPSLVFCDAGIDETTMDVELVLAMAPAAQIHLLGPLGTTWTHQLQEAADNGCAQMTTSFGFGNFSGNEEALVDEMAMQGQTILDASGDNGALTYADYGANAPNDAGTGQAQQALVEVAATILIMSDAGTHQYVGETAWSNDTCPGGSGGGPLQGSPAQWYQEPFATANHQLDGGASLMYANGPDVSASGSNVMFVVGGAAVPGGETSAAAPIWAGVIALANQTIGEGPYVGFASPALYSLFGAGGNFHDITTGSTAFNSTPGYPATTGYDLATGLGSPTGQLVSALASLTGGSPWIGPQNTPEYGFQSIAAYNGGLWGIDNQYEIWAGAPGSWTQVSGSPTSYPYQIAVHPLGGRSRGNAVWLVDGNLGAYSYNGSTWILENGTTGSGCSTGPHNALTSIAVGPAGTYSIWAVSDTSAGGCDKTIYYSDGIGTCPTWTYVSGVGAVSVAVSPSDGTPWILPCSGHVGKGTLTGSTWTFTNVDPFPWNSNTGGGPLDAGQYQGGVLASSIALGQAGYTSTSLNGGVGVWAVSTTGTVLDLLHWQGATNAAWSIVSGIPTGCQFAASCSHLKADFCRVMRPPHLQADAATSERG
jgi:hypothetical protein